MNGLEPGKYIAAISGGIDSIALLHMLQAQSDTEIVVAHFDHGIREDSFEDADFVEGLAAVYDLRYCVGQGRLGKNASEELARNSRYAFLSDIVANYGARAIITAHHQDDVIETAVLNMQRGTYRRGLVSLRSSDELVRPLLGFSKAEIQSYAIANRLEWRDDSTNSDQKYARNRVRAQLYKSLDARKRSRIIALLNDIQDYDEQIESIVRELLVDVGDLFPRSWVQQDDSASAELIAGWFRIHGAEFNKNTISRILEGSQTLQNGAKIDVDKRYYCLLTKDKIVLKQR